MVQEVFLVNLLQRSSFRVKKLYEYFGFKVVEKTAIPETRLTTWAMLRDVPS